MAEKTTDNKNDARVIDGESLGKAADPISKGTLIGIAAAVIFLIIAAVIIFMFYSRPNG